MQRHLPEKTLVLYDLGLSSRDVLTLKKACNCSIRVFEFDKYPAHVSTLKLKAYRPIIIQVVSKCVAPYVMHVVANVVGAEILIFR